MATTQRNRWLQVSLYNRQLHLACTMSCSQYSCTTAGGLHRELDVVIEHDQLVKLSGQVVYIERWLECDKKMIILEPHS